MVLVTLPVLLIAMLAIVVLEGRPIFYVSRRRLDAGAPRRVVKFRTMRRDAERLANRDTIPIVATRFLNLPPTSPLYTPVGRLIEALMLTEMPQLLHVLAGEMSIVGNRPLPENVVRSLTEAFPEAEDRFLVRSGLTGPIQLVGREAISDAARLEIEIAYCQMVMQAYSPLLDLKILAFTMLGGFLGRFRFTAAEVLALVRRDGPQALSRAAEERRAAVLPAYVGQQEAQRPHAKPGGSR